MKIIESERLAGHWTNSLSFKAIFFCVILWGASACADPQLTSWLTTYSGQYARAYTNTSKRTSGSSVTAWSGQSLPSYTDIPFVAYSSSWVYVSAADLPSYVIGPWLNPQGVMGTLYPANQNLINRFPRSRSAQSGTKTISGTGYSGLYVNGVAIFNFTDGKAWDPTNLDIVSGPHNKASYYWHRNAPVGEGFNFDYALGHQNPAGVYHTHEQPIALRYELGDHVDYNSSTKNYSESTNAVTQHSPIVGWAYDGYPIYGPYGYSVSNDASSGIRRMVSGYVLRNGQNGTDNLSNNLSVIPAWYARFRTNHFGGSYSTTTTQTRPSCSGTNYLGTFAEDFSYYGDLTNPATGQLYVRGTNTFDLDVYNGRWCVTPEFPTGTYAYFLDIDSNSTPTYPYAIAYEYYGTASGGSVTIITESVTTNFYGGADSALTLNTPTVDANDVVTLTWSSTEGGTYQVETSPDQSSWSIQRTNVSAAVGVSTTTTYTNSAATGKVYVRLERSALASYDDVGTGNGVVGQTNVQSFMIGNDPPTVANPIPNQTNTYGTGFTYTLASNTFTDIDSGQTLTYIASSAALTNTGISFNGTTRTFSATTVDATNSGTIAGTYVVQVIATDNGTPPMSATNSFTLVIKQAPASVTPGSATRVYGSANPTLNGALNGFVAADSITANYSTTATTNSAVGPYAVTATLNDPSSRIGNYLVATNAAALTVSQAPMTVTPNNSSRAYGQTNPILTGMISGIVDNDNVTANYSTTATKTSAVGTYPITTTLNDPGSVLGNYSITTNQGTLAVTNFFEAVTVTISNSIIQLSTTVTMDFTFTDPASGDSVVVAVTMVPYSASNADPVFKVVDFSGNEPIHESINSFLVNDGNWVDPWEGVNFSATLVSADTGINTNSIKFGIAGIGLRSDVGFPTIAWNSSGTTLSFMPTNTGLWTMDTTLASLNGTTYFGYLRSAADNGLYQLSDDSTVSGHGIAFNVFFTEGTPDAPIIGTNSFTNDQFGFSITGSSGAYYIVQATTNLSSPNWIPVSTNAAPFTFTDTNSASYPRRFYRVVSQ